MSAPLIRAATAADAGALAAIYGHHVLHGLGTFEEVPPSPAEMEQRRLSIVAGVAPSARRCAENRQ